MSHFLELLYRLGLTQGRDAVFVSGILEKGWELIPLVGSISAAAVVALGSGLGWHVTGTAAFSTVHRIGAMLQIWLIVCTSFPPLLL